MSEGQIISFGATKIQKFLGHDSANGMIAMVLFIGPAEAIPMKAGLRFETARVESSTEDVSSSKWGNIEFHEAVIAWKIMNCHGLVNVMDESMMSQYCFERYQPLDFIPSFRSTVRTISLLSPWISMRPSLPEVR